MPKIPPNIPNKATANRWLKITFAAPRSIIPGILLVINTRIILTSKPAHYTFLFIILIIIHSFYFCNPNTIHHFDPSPLFLSSQPREEKATIIGVVVVFLILIMVSAQSLLSPTKAPHKRRFCYDDDEDIDQYDQEEDGVELTQLGAQKTRNVLILMSDTGGGHRASAESIRDAFAINFGDQYRIFVKDVWKEQAGWPLNDMESQYKFMVKHVQLWKLAFHTTSPKWVHCAYLAALAAFYAKEIEIGMMEYKPDIIISVHPLMQHIPLWVLKWQGLQKRVLFVTVITDLNTCHRTWFNTGVNRCYCPSEEVAKRALLDGLEPSQVRVFGLPVRPSFCRAVISKDQLREELEMDPKLPAVLLMGGGEGMGPVKKTAKALKDSLFCESTGQPIGQLVVICGRNKTLASTLEAMDWKIPVKIRGFEKQMEKWMGACDCIITKAGPGTIAEALIRGLPIILNDFIPGQEVGNVSYVKDNGAGVFTKSPKETAKIVVEWFTTNTEELQKMSEKALKLAQPEAVFDIVNDIHELAGQQGPLANLPYSITSSFSFPSESDISFI